MALDTTSPASNRSPKLDGLGPEHSQKNDLGKLTDSLEQLNFVDQNITDLKRELSSFDRDEAMEGGQGTSEKDHSGPEKALSDSDKHSRDEKDADSLTQTQAPAQETHPEYMSYGLDGIFEAMKSYRHEKSPFLPTGKLDTESLKQKLLQEMPQPPRFLDEDSVFYHRDTLNANYGKTPGFKNSNFSNISVDTLFYAFYTAPGDVMQKMAATELFKRQWRYHQGNQLWFRQDPKKLTWVYFDLASWSVKNCSTPPEPESALLSKEEFQKLPEAEA